MPVRRRSRPVVSSAHPLLLDWWADLEGERRTTNTRLAYVRDLTAFAAFVRGELGDATPEDLRRYARQMIADGLSAATRARRIAALRRFYEWLRRRQGRAYSVAHDLVAPPHVPRPRQWWTDAQVARFRAAFSGGEPRVLRDRAMAELGLMGLGVGEVVRLDIERLVRLSEPQRAAVIVRRRAGTSDALPLTPEARGALLRWLAARPAVPTTAVFFRLPFQGRRARLHYASVERIFKRYAAASGVPLPAGIAFHHLRHTAGRRLADAGVDPEDAQRLLGHAGPGATRGYYDMADARLRETVARLRYRSRAGAKAPHPDEEG